ncbi:MAG: hypothetical protein WCY53_05690 [Sphaerochaetaceae bacterium]
MTKRTLRYIISTFVLLLLIISCGGSLITTLRVGDILAVADYSDLVIYANAKIEIETFGLEDETDLKKKVTEWFRGAENFGSRSGDLTTFLTADIEIPIYNYYNNYYYKSTDPFSILLYNAQDRIYLSFLFSESKFKEIDDYVQENFFSSLSLKDWNFSITLYNDTKEKQTVALNYVYVNDEPLLFEESYSLNPRETLDIRISDLLRDFAVTEGFSTFGELIK